MRIRIKRKEHTYIHMQDWFWFLRNNLSEDNWSVWTQADHWEVIVDGRKLKGPLRTEFLMKYT